MTYYFNQSDLEKYLAEYKELKNIEKELLKENKLANNYDLYEQYMSKIQTYYLMRTLNTPKYLQKQKKS